MDECFRKYRELLAESEISSGMGRDRKISRRDKTRLGQSLELISRQDKTRHGDKTNEFKTKQDSKRHVETRQDFQVLRNLDSRQVKTFAIFKSSRRDGTRQLFPSRLGREIETRLNFKIYMAYD